MKKKTGKVLGIGAHPDDLEISCGGTLAKFTLQGWQVMMVSVCKGDKSGNDNGRESIIDVRRKEAKLSAGIIGAKCSTLGFSDSEIFTGKDLRDVIIDLIRDMKPDVVITHYPEDYHADHRLVASEVSSSVYIASSKRYKTRNRPINFIPVLYFMEPLTGIGFCPTEYVDITETMDRKIQMLKQHKSQLLAIKRRGGIDIIQLVKDTAKFRGWQSGVKYAEGFCVNYIWPHLKTLRVLP
ncbi:MAG: PIG-L family deacetylase [bacterium]|nr:PIG-L family deacetylase [bacterium]